LTAADPELQKALESLRTCQLELAQVRGAQEQLMEDLAKAQNDFKDAQKRLATLSSSVNEHLVHPAGDRGTSERALRWWVRRRRSRSEEWQQARQIAASSLFNGPWYLRRHPAAAATGLPPALHYLRHGAPKGLNPSPKFNTRRYLSTHPEVAASGMNPLLHQLQQREPGRSNPAKP
jgi:hypothetical protein